MYGSGSLDYYTSVRVFYSEIYRAKKRILKNFEDMDLVNAKTRQEIQLIIDEMTEICDRLKRDVKDYTGVSE